ncbi:MAG: hypothetical protein EPN41_11305 [Candidimonas sp.]|nr:MAG: hypothetical protein EPN41_11305 [Candidimonas sp.]
MNLCENNANFAWNDTLRLAGQHGLTLYDATYPELALRLSPPLATRDSALRKAAVDWDVPLLGA